MAVKTVVYSTVGTYQVNLPADFGTLVSVEALGAGAKGTSAGGGGGGAYAKSDAVLGLYAGKSVWIRVGLGGGAGVPDAGGQSFFSSSSSSGPGLTTDGALAVGASIPQGGQAASCIATLAYNGGNGGANADITNPIGAGGGGAAGPGGAGRNGGNGGGGSTTNGGGGGGGGAGGALSTAGANGASNAIGGAGGAGPGGGGGASGARGVAPIQDAGFAVTGGGGGGGTLNRLPSSGSYTDIWTPNGIDWYGPGAGGGGMIGAHVSAGAFGGGGGNGPVGSSSYGGSGLVVLTYNTFEDLNERTFASIISV